MGNARGTKTGIDVMNGEVTYGATALRIYPQLLQMLHHSLSHKGRTTHRDSARLLVFNILRRSISIFPLRVCKLVGLQCWDLVLVAAIEPFLAARGTTCSRIFHGEHVSSFRN